MRHTPTHKTNLGILFCGMVLPPPATQPQNTNLMPSYGRLSGGWKIEDTIYSIMAVERLELKSFV